MQHNNGFIHLSDEEAAEIRGALSLMRKQLYGVFVSGTACEDGIDQRIDTINQILNQFDTYSYPTILIGAGTQLTIDLSGGEAELGS